MKSKKVRRVLAVIMSLAMILTAFPFTLIASAESEEPCENPAIVYHDDLNRVIKRDPYTPGYTFRADYPAFAAGLQKKNVGWKTSSGTEYSDGYVLNNLSEDLNVYPELQEGHYVRFNSNGGSPVKYQFVAPNGKATKPDNPTKSGYTFGGWYTDDGTFLSAYNFNNTVTAETQLYAKWTPSNAEYTVRVWLQQPDGTYRYNFSFTKTGTTGGEVAFTDTDKARDDIKKATWYGEATYYWYNTIKIVPATSVYYEEDFGDGETAIVYTGNWEVVGDASKSDSMQDEGESGISTNPYGYDSSYNDDAQFSNGTAKKVTGSVKVVNKESVFEATASFTFTGTGFEIISRTDLDCGMISVLIFKHGTKDKVATVPVVNKGVNTLYQIPVITYKDLPYGTYDVVINVCAPVAILGITNSVFYLDAIRIYNPMGDNAEAHDVYVQDKEANAEITYIRDSIITAKDLDVTDQYSSIYVDTLDTGYTASGTIGDIKNPEFTDEEKRLRTIDPAKLQNYELLGPNGEVYISKGTGIGFVIECEKLPESVQIGVKAPMGGNAKLLVTTYGKGNPVKEINVSSATGMYYDITDAVKFELVDGVYKATVVLSNTSESLLSVTNLKTTSADTISDSSVALTVNKQVFAQVFDTVYVQNAASTPSYDVVNAALATSAPAGSTVTLTFNTSKFVDSIIVTDENGNEIK